MLPVSGRPLPISPLWGWRLEENFAPGPQGSRALLVTVSIVGAGSALVSWVLSRSKQR